MKPPHQPRGRRADWPRRIKEFLAQHPNWFRTCPEIGDALALTDPVSRKSLSEILIRMANNGELRRVRQAGDRQWRYASP